MLNRFFFKKLSFFADFEVDDYSTTDRALKNAGSILLARIKEVGSGVFVTFEYYIHLTLYHGMTVSLRIFCLECGELFMFCKRNNFLIASLSSLFL